MSYKWLLLLIFVPVLLFLPNPGYADVESIKITSLELEKHTIADNTSCPEWIEIRWHVEILPPIPVTNLSYQYSLTVNNREIGGGNFLWGWSTEDVWFSPSCDLEYGNFPYEVELTVYKDFLSDSVSYTFYEDGEIDCAKYCQEKGCVLAENVAALSINSNDSCDCVCPVTDLMVYPSEKYIDKGEVLLKFAPNTKVFLEIPKGSNGIEFDDSNVDNLTTYVTTDSKGEGRTTVKYTFNALQDMLNSATTRIIAYYNCYGGAYGTKIAEYNYNVYDNWYKLISDYKDPKKCPGARANPCTLWFQNVTGDSGPAQLLNGIANNVFALIGDFKHIPFYTYKGQELFACGHYQARIMSWYFRKKLNKDKNIAAEVNGIECFPYTMGGMHKFVGIFPAGISDDYKKVAAVWLSHTDPTHLFLDPWILQHGPEVLTDEEMIYRMRDIPGLLAIGTSLINPAIGITAALGRVGIAVFNTVPEAKGPSDYIQAIIDVPAGTIRFDPSYHSIDIDKGIFVNTASITGQPQDFKDPDCPTATDHSLSLHTAVDVLSSFRDFIKKKERETISKGIGVLLHLMCPISVKISSQSGAIFEFDYVNETFSGSLPVIGISIPKEDGTRILDFVVFEEEFNVEIKAMDNGKLTVCSIDPNETRMASYEDIQLKTNDVYKLNITKNSIFPELIGPDGIKILPDIRNFLNAMPWMPLLLLED